MATMTSTLSLRALERPVALIGKGLGQVVRLLFLWQTRSAQRLHLAALDDRLLRDMGLTRADILLECDKPFWKS